MGSLSSSAAQPKNWEATANISRKVLSDSIPRQWLIDPEKIAYEGSNVVKFLDHSGVLTPEEVEITSQNVEGLLTGYESGKWNVETVTKAFLKRATIGNQILNFATEFLVDSALETARALDTHFQNTKTLFGPLHGIPISVKEHVAIGGHICHASFVSKISNIPEDDAHIIQLVKNAGAVIHVRTNQPQSIMHLDCKNNITGMTLNPIHKLLSPGGSSGGEGAVVGSKCSVLGIGTDIGGSIRVPASFCNAYGFKPTALRNPSLGLAGIIGGQESIRGCVGPLANSMDDLVRFERAVLDQEPWDVETALVPLAWRKFELAKDGFTVGILYDDGMVWPHPPVLRALETAQRKLQAAGIKTVTFKPLEHSRGWDIVKKLYYAEGGIRLRTALEASGEPALPLTEHALSFGGHTIEAGQPLSISENWDLNFQREKYRREYHATLKKEGVDVVLCPAYVGVGAMQGQPKYWHYTSIWNILDQPAVSFPSGIFADKNTDVVDASYVPRSEKDRREWEAYDPVLFDGLPVSVQLAGKHHRDEELLEAAKIIERAMRQ